MARIIYVHGIFQKKGPEDLKQLWDLALAGKDLGPRTSMAYWADLVPADSPKDAAGTGKRGASKSSDRGIALEALQGTSVASNEDALAFAQNLLDEIGASSPPPTRRSGSYGTRVLPFPRWARVRLSRSLIEKYLRDTAIYLFDEAKRKDIRQRFKTELLKAAPGAVVVAHSQGSMIAWDVLNALTDAEAKKLGSITLVTLGSPLGLQEVQDHLATLGHDELRRPPAVGRWFNFAGVLDLVAFDRRLATDFSPRGQIDPKIEDKTLFALNPDRANGSLTHGISLYLTHSDVRRVIGRASGMDTHASFVMAKDVAQQIEVEGRHPVLIEVLEAPPEGWEEGQGTPSEQVAAKLAAMLKKHKDEACIEPLTRFVAARLTADELMNVARERNQYRVYAIWRNSRKRALAAKHPTRLTSPVQALPSPSVRALQIDAARSAYAAKGAGVTWAVLDTGVQGDHPHFAAHDTLKEIWDCTKLGPPRRVLAAKAKDVDGHGTHVAGLIAGWPDDPSVPASSAAPEAKLVIYKVLDDDGSGEDAWIIKALDHIEQANAGHSRLSIHGINLSLGGPFDADTYGCGHSPICAELRRQWRGGVIVVVAAGNEGTIEVESQGEDLRINHSHSIGDPANLEDAIAVGSVNGDKPYLYGVSSFSSRGPTADGRSKPDVVAPGERVLSCAAPTSNTQEFPGYREESGTSMAAPSVSGLLAAFLSVRREYVSRPDEVKQILLKHCNDLRRDRYSQGHGLPNLMKMLLES
ncbi:S8 family peptidase [Aquimonas voraii]|uniref:Serine protease, subtilisin family n=1 Tax=Aquimonas voraii TaxID=265719 RepID=A0A1G6US66_9GAMM|nr:S8 family peptidase [Aquimonas voraii]SDD44143.1 Serine protease, subtilisin family [Aquimonas voraii]